MALGDLVQQAIHSASGVPRLATAAMRAGVGPAGVVQVLRISEASLRTAATHGRGAPGRTNALRHFMWQALLTARFGADVARSLAHTQEAGTPNRRDSRVDQHNNAVGQAYGAAHPELCNGSIGDAVSLLVPVGLEKWDAGELTWVEPSPGEG